MLQAPTVPVPVETRPTLRIRSGQLQRTRHRRRLLLAALLITALVSLVLAVVVQGTMWRVHGVADGLLVVYLAALVRCRNAAAEQEMTRGALSR